MGRDVAVIIRKNKLTARETEFFYPFDRGLGALIQNAHFVDNSVLSRVGEALSEDVSFLYLPDYFNYVVDDLRLEWAESESEKRDLLEDRRRLAIESENSWVAIDDFTKHLEGTTAVLTIGQMSLTQYRSMS